MSGLQLKQFQIEDAQFLAERTRALLASEPGTGKTATLITACNLVGARRVCVVCPRIGMEHWKREAFKWSKAPLDLQITDWGNAQVLVDHLSRDYNPQWDVLIADECHFAKNPQAKRTRAVFGTGGLGWYAKRIWAVSGTPMPNSPVELWPLLRAFGKTRMDYQAFAEYFCRLHPVSKKVLGAREDRLQELRGILKGVARRRLKKEVLPELGEIDVQEWHVQPDTRFVVGATVDSQEAALKRRLAGMSDDEIVSFLSDPTEDFATLRRYNALLKAPAVFETVRFELENGLLDKVVIYGYHKEALAALHREFGKARIDSTLIYGDTSVGERDDMIERWKQKGVVMLASIIVASTAIDFTAAHQGIMLEMDWVPSSNTQAMQRMHRHGQTNPVTIRVALGSEIDEIVNRVLLRKTRDIQAVLDRPAGR